MNRRFYFFGVLDYFGGVKIIYYFVK